MPTQPLRFLRRGEPVVLHDVPADRSLLDLLRDDLGCTGTKEGCGEGDCGACTVVLGEAVQAEPGQGATSLRLSAINSCIRLAHSIDGMALWTVEDLAQDPLIGPVPAAACQRSALPAQPNLHPVQQALLDCHGSQCGFCTPGFVMSMFALYESALSQDQAPTRVEAQEALSGNLCRCTGYRPILDAAQCMTDLPRLKIDRPQILQKLAPWHTAATPSAASDTPWPDSPGYHAPRTLEALLQARASLPQAQVVAGCTDVGLWLTKQHRQFPLVLDVTRVAQLRTIDTRDGWLRIGAAATLSESFAALIGHWPQLQRFASRFAGLPVRNSGTLGGNVANGSPIGDSMPLLIALGAQVVLASVHGERSLPLENLYTGYRRNVMASDELLVRIDIPLPSGETEFLRAYKVSKRFDDDISAVCLVVRIVLEHGVVRAASIGAGGVAATPSRAVQAEAALVGQTWQASAAQAAGLALQAQFEPISDMRASGAYRKALLASLMQRYWLESQGQAMASLDDFSLASQEPAL